MCARRKDGPAKWLIYKQKSPASDWPLARGERPITGRRFVARDPCAGLGCLTEGDGESTRCVRGLRMNYSGSVTQEREVRHYSQAGCRSMLQPQVAVFSYFSTWRLLSFGSAGSPDPGCPRDVMMDPPESQILIHSMPLCSLKTKGSNCLLSSKRLLHFGFTLLCHCKEYISLIYSSVTAQ